MPLAESYERDRGRERARARCRRRRRAAAPREGARAESSPQGCAGSTSRLRDSETRNLNQLCEAITRIGAPDPLAWSTVYRRWRVWLHVDVLHEGERERA